MLVAARLVEGTVRVELDTVARPGRLRVRRRRQRRIGIADVLPVDLDVHGPDVLVRAGHEWITPFLDEVLRHDVGIAKTVVDRHRGRRVVGFLISRIEGVGHDLHEVAVGERTEDVRLLRRGIRQPHALIQGEIDLATDGRRGLIVRIQRDRGALVADQQPVESVRR